MPLTRSLVVVSLLARGNLTRGFVWHGLGSTAALSTQQAGAGVNGPQLTHGHRTRARAKATMAQDAEYVYTSERAQVLGLWFSRKKLLNAPDPAGPSDAPDVASANATEGRVS